jgi:beta-glucosidase
MSLNSWHDTGLAPEERAELLLQELTLDEKMAQVNCVFPFDKTYQDMDWLSTQTPFGIGEVSTLEMRRLETLEAAADWQRTVQKVVMENSPHHIPAIFHMEGLCGPFIQAAVSLPSGIARGAGFHPELEEEIGAVVAEQEAACGITHILAPVLDISRDSRMGRQGETYGEDPALAAAMGAAYVKGVQNTRIGGRAPESVAKHFLAFHNSQGGIHGTHSDTPERLLREVYGKPFQAAIQAGLRGIMPCYCSIDGEPASVSEKLLTGLLREEMGFDGLCISDYGGIGNSHTVQHIGETMAETGLLALRAGMDVEMPSPAGYGKELRDLFANGEADMRLLDRAVLRVLTAKFRMGLFEHPFAMEDEQLRAVFYDSRGLEVTRQSARESLVLLKNDGVLPLDAGKVRKIALIGPHGDNARMFFGGYTHLSMMESTYAVANSIAGVAGIENTSGREIQTVPGTNIQSDLTEEFDPILRRQKPDYPSLLAALREAMPGTEISYAYGYPIAGNDCSGFEEALELVRSADVVLLTLGGKYGTCSIASMGEGVDGANINLPPCQEAFIRAVAELGKPLVGVHFDGRPISSDAADQCLNAILEAWTPGEAGGEAVAGALTGKYNPSGKLPVSVAYHAGQIPVYYNHPWGSCEHQGESIGFASYVDLPHTPRYPFGYGLSYTEFQYDRLRISAREVRPEEKLEVSVDVRNVGRIAGDEVVQLYLSDCYASRTRPVQELAGFKRVHLEPGEARTVVFTVDLSQMAFLDKDMRWKIEKGDFAVRIGTSSADVRVSDTVRVTEDAWIDGRKRAMCAGVEVRT